MKNHTENIGKQAAIRIGDLTVDVRIMNIRSAFGRIDYEVTPVAGTGSRWIDSNNVDSIDSEE